MKRFASQITFCAPDKILRRNVVEQDENNIVTNRFGLDEQRVESSHTAFFDGIISCGIVSLQQQTAGNIRIIPLEDYNYIDLSANNQNKKILKDSKPLILDFGGAGATEISQQLQLWTDKLSDFSVFEIIAACTYYPAVVLGLNARLEIGVQSQLILWQQVDLVNKRITGNINIKFL